MKHVATPRRLVCLLLALLFCVLAMPTKAFAYETNLRIRLYNEETGGQIPAGSGDLTLAANVKKTNSGNSYEYGPDVNFAYGYYHSKSYAFKDNTYEALGWTVAGGENQINIPGLLMDSSLFSSSRAGQYDVTLRGPSDYQGVGPGWIRMREFLGLHNYEAHMPGTSALVKEGNEYILKVYLKRRTSRHLTFQIPNLQTLKQAGYTFKLKYDVDYSGNTRIADNAQQLALREDGDKLSLDVTKVDMGQYALMVVDPSGNESVATEFTIEPLRIPRVDPSKRLAQSSVISYDLHTLNYTDWKNVVGKDDANRMMQALDARRVEYKSHNRMTSVMLDVENKWTRVRSLGGTATVTEIFPEDPGYNYVGHVLKVDLGVNALTIKKEWPSDAQRPESVSIDYRADGGQTSTVTLSQSNNWSAMVVVPSNKNLTFVEKTSMDHYKPEKWVLSGTKDGGVSKTSVNLPTQEDGQTAQLDVTGGASWSVEEQLAAKALLGTNAATLTLTNQKVKTFNVKKEWDIDAAKTDKPASITVALQKREDAEKRWVTVAWQELNDANAWKATMVVADDGAAASTYRIRELSATSKTVWAKTDLDAPAIKSALEGLSNWNDLWVTDYSDVANLQEFLGLFTGSRTNYVPTVVYNVGDHQTKYYVTYSTDVSSGGNTTTIKDTAVLDVSIYKRWLMFGNAKKPSSVNLMLMGRTAVAEGAQATPYLPVYDALYGDITTSVPGLDALKDALQTGGVNAQAIDNYIKEGVAIATAKEQSDSGKSWQVQFGVRKYDAAGMEREYLGAELVTGLTKVAADGIMGTDLPVMIQPIAPRYFTVFGKAYKIPALCADYERTSNVINTWLSVDPSNVGRTIGGTKQWDDNNNAAGKRPAQITLHVYAKEADGSKAEVTGSPVVAKESDGWAWSLMLPTGDSSVNKELVVEEEIPDGYEVTPLSAYDLLNTQSANAPETIRKTGKVVWDDDNDSAKKRPSGVTVRIKADGQEVDTRIVTKDNDWTWTFPNLPKQKDGKDITYTVEEDTIPGYGTTTDDDPEKTTITNRYLDKRINISVRKVWDDNNDADGNRQRTVLVRLLADGSEKAHTVLTASEGWQGTFKNMPKYNNGQEITYTVDEDVPPEYKQTSVTGNVTEGFTITNKYQPTTKSISVRKEWDDNNNAANKRPASVTVRLRANGASTGKSLTLNASNNWEGTFEAPKYWKLRVADYTVTEDAVDGYKQRITGDDDSGFVVTNTRNWGDDKVRISGTKTWDDSDDQDGKRPRSITVKLLADGVVKDTKTVTAANGWAYDFGEQPKFKDGTQEKITYAVDENPVDGYSRTEAEAPAAGSNAPTSYDIVNTHVPETVEVRGTKTWDDENDVAGKRPEHIVVRLFGDGVELDDDEINAEDNWTWSFVDLPKYDNGKLISYTVTEDAVEDYACEAVGYNMTNTYVPATTSVNVRKVWDDANNRDGKRPANVTVRLIALADEEEAEHEAGNVVLSEQNKWTHTFAEVDADKTYRVEEDAVADYTKSVSGDQQSGFVVTNKYEPKTMSVKATKTWAGDEGHTDQRPASIVVKLLANGVEKNTRTLSAADVLEGTDGWTCVWEDLPVFEQGVQISYDVVEETVDNYEASYARSGNAEQGYTVAITNTHKPQKTSVNVRKVWDDNNNAAQQRPTSVQVQLKANDVATGNPVELNANNNWSTTFNDLNKQQDGANIVYTVQEVGTLPEGYESRIEGNAASGFAIVNTYQPATINVAGTKVWADNNDAAKKRPAEIVVRLLADGVETDNKTVRAAEGGTWSWSFADQPTHKDGAEIEYTMTEDEVAGYATEVTGSAADGFTITNTFESGTTNITVTKEWKGDSKEPAADEEDGQEGNNEQPAADDRPTSVTVKLKAGDQPVQDADGNDLTVTLSANNNWTHTFEDLPTHKDGAEIAYTVDEDPVPEGYTKEVAGSAAEGFTITNTKESSDPEGYEVEKIWDIDTAKQDRPESITVALQKLEMPDSQDGSNETQDPKWTTVKTAKLSMANNWRAKLVPPAEQDGNGGQGGEQQQPTYRIRELKGDEKSDPVWAKNDSDAKTTKSLAEILRDPNTWANVEEGKLSDDSKALLNQIKNAATNPSTWYDFWKNGVDQKKLDDLLTATSAQKYDPTVVFDGKDGKTKYYVTYKTSGKKTTITNTAVLDVSIWKRWLMFGNAKKPESVNLMLFGRTKMAEGANQKIPYLPVYDALYGDKMSATDLADTVGLKDMLLKIPGVTEEKINNYLKVGLAVKKVKADEESPNSLLKGWNAHFGVRKYDKLGQEREYLGAEMVTGLMKIGTDVLLGVDFPVMIQPFSPRYFTVFGKAYKIPVIDANYERTSNVINTWLSADFDIGRGIAGTKYWDDGNASDRPSEVKLHIYAKQNDGSKQEVTGSPVTVKASDGWVWSLAIPKGDPSEGKELSIEEEVPEGYSVRYEGCDVFNKKDGTSTVTVSGKKTWDDNNNQDGKRPSSIKIRLLADGTRKDSRTVTAGNGWSWTFSNLPKKNAEGKDIKYTIEEDAVSDYTTKVSGYNVTNTYKGNAKIKVSGKKTWKDDNDAAGKRPQSITVRLRADGTEVSYRETSAATGWKWDFGEMPRYKDGKQIAYTLTEDAVAGYTSSVSGFDVTNTYTSEKPETTSVTVTKKWDDNNDAAKKRPQKVTVRLQANGADAGKSLTLSASGGWTGTFAGLDKKDAGGNDISYTVTEEAVDDYGTPKITGTAQSGFTITNTYAQKRSNIVVSKVWDDGNNADGLRPKGVIVRLKVGTEEKAHTVLTEADGWRATFRDLPLYENGNEIAYTVDEGDVNGYTATVSGSAAAGFVITNKHTPATPTTTQVKVTKVWNDNDNADGKRPESVTVRLRANGREVKSAELKGNSWEHTFGDLPTKEQGKDITYTVTEDAVGDYTTSITGSAAGGFTITNTHTSNKTSISVSKVWDDENDSCGKRPTSVTVKLRANGAETDKSLTLSADGGWTGTFTDLDQKDASGQDMAYTVVEDPVPAGYTTNVEGDATKGFTITNKLETVNIEGKKTWDDVDDADGIRPDYIVVRLFADGEEVDDTEVTEDDDWSWSFEGLPKYKDGGQEIAYTVGEDQVDGYQPPTISGYNITNKHTYETTSVTVSKVWEHGENPVDVQPQKAVVSLLADGVQMGEPVELTAPGWSHTFENLPKQRDGRSIEYTVVEDPVDDYTTTVTGNAASGFVITNTYAPGKINATVDIVWKDEDNFDGIRPTSVTVDLYANDQLVLDETDQPRTLTLNATANGWHGTFVGLDKYDSEGKAIEYEVRERLTNVLTTIDGPGTYAIEYSVAGTYNFTVTNIHTPQHPLISGNKVWDDDNDRDDVRPDYVVVHLVQKVAGTEENKIIDTCYVTEDDDWHFVFDDLPTSDISDYTVTEDEVPGYTTSIAEDKPGSGAYTITNSRNPEKTSINVRKVWDDQGVSGREHPAVTVRLLKSVDGGDFEDTDETKVLSENNNGWEDSFTDLPANENGKPVSYSVREEETPAAYTSEVVPEVDENNEVTYVITNTLKTLDVVATQEWDDFDDIDGIRPEAVTLRFSKGNESVVVKEQDWWTHEWPALPAYDNDMHEIEYTVEQAQTPEGYGEAKVDVQKEDGFIGFVLTNEHVPETVAISGRKVWDDDDNDAGLRPSEVTVRLFAIYTENGETVKMEVENAKVSEATDWKWRFDDLLGRAYEHEYTYTVEEDPIDEYTSKVEVDEATGEYVITNTLEREINVTGQKIWVDDDDAYAKRPQSITVYLLANNEVVASTIVTADNDWTYEFVGLPKESDGQEVTYSVREGLVDDYGAMRDGYDFYNVIDDEYVTTTIFGHKVWDDNDDPDGKRPASVVVYLLANDVVVASTNATAENDWKWEFKDVPANDQNGAITYTVAEGRVAGYTTTIDRPSPEEFVITNSTSTPPQDGDVVVEGTKTWEDDDDAKGLRPQSILVHLLAGNTLVDSRNVTADDGWAWKFDHLPKLADESPFGYRVVEGQVGGYQTTYDGLNITNTLRTTNDEKVSVRGSKVWDDNDDAEHKRPTSIDVYLVANGVEIVDSRTVTADDGWAWEFTDLPKLDGTREVAYSFVEGEVPGYTATVEGSMADGFVITNTMYVEPPTPNTVVVEGAKTWDDDNNALGLRPDHIVVSLLANGEARYRKVVSEEDGWQWRFANLPAQENGKDVVYTIAEEAVEGYVAKVDGYNVTNTVVEPTRHDPPVTKVLVGDTPLSASDFVFVLTAKNDAFPMPNNKTGGSAEMTITGAGSGEFGWITFTKAGTYEYTVTEKDTGVAGYTYDTSVYTIRYEVVEHDGKLEATRTFYKDGKVVEGLESAVFTNEYRIPTTPSVPTTPTTTTVVRETIPNTGDGTLSFLPILLAAISALVFARRKA